MSRISALSGEWEGTVVWVGTHDAPAKISAHYHITGNGSAVVETLSNGMTSVYYPDGADLKMTHFCAAQNQPRLKVTEFSPDLSKIAFSFVDITNLTSPSAGHVVGFEVRFLTSDHITLRFRFTIDGKDNYELVDLEHKD